MKSYAHLKYEARVIFAICSKELPATPKDSDRYDSVMYLSYCCSCNDRLYEVNAHLWQLSKRCWT